MHIYLEFYICVTSVHLFQLVLLYILTESIFFFLSVHKIMVHFIINGILDSIIYSVGDVNVIQSGKFDNTF